MSPASPRRSLLSLACAVTPDARWLADPEGHVRLAALASGWSLAAPRQAFAGATVLIATAGQLPAVLAALQLDGVAARILLCPPDLPPAHLPGILRHAEATVVVSDGSMPALIEAAAGLPLAECSRVLSPQIVMAGLDPAIHGEPANDVDSGRKDRSQTGPYVTSGAAWMPGSSPGMTIVAGVEAMRDSPLHAEEGAADTEWVLFTSGTTGAPKLVLHTLASLIGPLQDGLAVPSGAVWSTFYDVRRYGGLTILLRALLGGGSMVLSHAGEPVAAFLQRAGESGVTHMSGTPSHWRRALMSAAAGAMAPAYVRLSGEVADQAILDQLARAFPGAQVAHAFASTEAGVAFDVRDGLAGFPAALMTDANGQAQMRVVDGSLQIRSTRTAARYLGERTRALREADDFVDTGDMVELRGGRYYFAGRREGVINVGGQKVFPEEVEAVINVHPAVRMARVWARPSPITGAVVAADVVLRADPEAGFGAVRDAILAACRAALPAHKVPVSLRRVDTLEVAASGKLVRVRA